VQNQCECGFECDFFSRSGPGRTRRGTKTSVSVGLSVNLPRVVGLGVLYGEQKPV
jgi:hypothetical protein